MSSNPNPSRETVPLRFKKEGNIWVEDRERSVLQAVAASGPFIH
jgi:hypothetical protein